MTDRELLEAAALATGEYAPAPDRMPDGVPGVFVYDGKPWNPLEDDGDALRLAVKLYLWEAVRLAHRELGGPGAEDMYAATRRAIVRAAAALAPK